MTGQWDYGGPSFHRVTLGVRGRGDIKIWFDGEIPGGYTPQVELEWSDVLGFAEPDNNSPPDEFSISAYPNPFNSAVSISAPEGAKIEIFDINGRRISVISRRVQPDEKSRADQEDISRQTRNDKIREFVWRPDETIGSGVFLVRATILDGNKGLKPLVSTISTKRIVYLK